MKEIIKTIRDKLSLTEVWFKLILLLLFIGLYFLSTSYPEKSKQFPQLIITLTLIMILVSLSIDFTSKETVAKIVSDVDGTELKVRDDEPGISKWMVSFQRKRFYQAWGIIAASTAIGFLGGFLFSSFSLFIGFALFSGKRTRKDMYKNTFIAAMMTLLIYVVFQWIMGVPLLTGILWDLS